MSESNPSFKGLWEQIQEGSKTTISQLSDWFNSIKQIESVPRIPRAFTILTGYSGQLILDVEIEKANSGIKVSTFTFWHKRIMWETPYFKGNLWKIMIVSKGHYRVYYGTKMIAYCTTMLDCYKLIPEHKDLKHQEWKRKMRHKRRGHTR